MTHFKPFRHLKSFICLLLLFTGSLLTAQQTFNPDAFLTTWRTTETYKTIQIKTHPSESYDYTIDWGDGNTNTHVTGNIEHTYTDVGDFTVSISGVFPRIYNPVYDLITGEEIPPALGAELLLSIDQWGPNVWSSMSQAFGYFWNMQILAQDTPNLSQVTDMSYMFERCFNFNSDINNWDVSHVTNMQLMFGACFNFNQPLDHWDVSNVTNMSDMFGLCFNFNQPLNHWNVKNVQNMGYMFYRATAFNQDISNWNVKNVQNMRHMFSEATTFNKDLGQWNVKNVVNMESMFINSGLSTANYDSTLIGWSNKALQNNVSLDASSTYCLSQEARQYILDTYGWTINDGGPAIGFGEDLDNDGITDCADDCPNDPYNTCTAVECDGDKYQICHRKKNGTYQTLCVNLEDYLMHKAHGDTDGACNGTNASRMDFDSTTKSETLNEDVKLYPNPARTSVTVESTTSIQVLELSDVTGKVLFNKTFKYGLNSYTMDVSTLPQGLYLLSIKSGTEILIKRLAKQ